MSVHIVGDEQRRDHGRLQGAGLEAWLNTTSPGTAPENARQIGLVRAQ